MSAKMNIPELRFAEFSGEWKSYKLGDLIEIKSASRVLKSQWTESGVPFFRTSDVVAQFKGLENTNAYIPMELFNELSNKSGRVIKNDLLVTGGGSVGIPYLIKTNEPLYFKDADLLWFKNTDSLNGLYLYAFLLTRIFRRYLSSITHTGTISHYTIEQAKSTPIKLPEYQEQEKIASFLSSVDAKIEQLDKKKKFLQEYKKGAMQKIFSLEIRFKDENGNEYPKWNKYELNDLIEVSSKKFNPKVNSENKKCIELEHLSQGTGALLGFTYSNEQESIKNLFEVNQVLFGKLRPYLKKFFKPDFDGVCSSEIWVLNGKKVVNNYLFQLVQTYKFNQIANVSSGSKMPRSDWKYMAEIPFLIPSLKEQTKIANFLSAIDAKIGLSTKELDATKEFKKALLQKMFV